MPVTPRAVTGSWRAWSVTRTASWKAVSASSAAASSGPGADGVGAGELVGSWADGPSSPPQPASSSTVTSRPPVRRTPLTTGATTRQSDRDPARLPGGLDPLDFRRRALGRMNRFYLACTNPVLPTIAPFFERVRPQPGWHVRE